MGKRGPQPGTGGRPRKALSEKLMDGNPGKRELKVIELPTLEGAEMPKPNAYLSDKQKTGHDFQAVKIYEDLWHWLQERKCENLISASVMEHYALSAARLIQCEQCISEYGFLAKHPTTGNAIASPYVAMSQQYMKQVNQVWYQIYQIVKENCSVEWQGATPQDDVMERLLRTRNGS